MTSSLVILCAAIVALVAFAVSAAIGLSLSLLRRRIARLAPAAQARIFLLAALLPVLAAAVVLIAALAPSFGWIADHCVVAGDPHVHHPHVCANHHVATWPALPLIGLACFIAARCFAAVSRRLFALGLSRFKARSLLLSSSEGELDSVRVLPIADEPQAFVIGLFRPTLFVTQSLATGASREHLNAVLAHERAHIRRRDPLRRFVAGIGLSFHLPGIARWLEISLSRAQEMAADREAADAVGEADVASALVALAKSRVRVPRSALAFSGAGIEARVMLLMDERVGRDWPKRSTLALGAAVSIAAISIGADAVHHGVEMLLGAFGG